MAQRALTVLAWLAAILILAVAVMSYSNWAHALPDVGAYWDGAAAIARGESPYNASHGVLPKRYIYPPLLATLLAPSVSVTRDFALAVWMAANLAGVALSLMVCVRLLGRRLSASWIVLAACIGIAPVIANLEEGQTNLWVLLLVLLAVEAAEQERPGTAGVLLGLATHMKVLPVAVIVAFALQRRWRSVQWAGAALAAGVAATCTITVVLHGMPQGLDLWARVWSDWLSLGLQSLYAGNVMGAEQFFIPNSSLPAVTHRLFTDTELFFRGPAPEALARGPLLIHAGTTWATGLAWCLLAILGALAIIATLRLRHTLSGRLAGIGGLWLAAHLANPTFWEHHLVAIALPFLAVVGSRPRLLAVVASLWGGLITVPYGLVFLGTVGPRRDLLLYGAPTAVVITTIAIGWFAAHSEAGV